MRREKPTTITISTKAKQQIVDIKKSIMSDGSREPANNDVIEMGIELLHKQLIGESNGN
jgi:hypothetical protein